MTRRNLGPLAFLFAALPALAAGPKTETASYLSGKETVSGYLALPSGEGRHPALVVIHEWWGQNDWVKGKARSFAEKGFVALAVDLYRGKATADADAAHQLMRGMPEDRAIRDLKAAFDYLASRPDVDPARIGSVGWCMGGGYSLALAAEEPRLAATVIYYGRLMTDEAAIRKIKAKLLGSFGATDGGIPPESVKAFEEQAKRLGISADFKVYPDVGHAFASSSNPKVFDPKSAADADARADAFFASVLATRK